MRRLVTACLIAASCLPTAAARAQAGPARPQGPAAPSAEPAPAAEAPAVPPPVYDEAADAAADIASALARAARENRRVLVQWGANWCGWCKLLHGLCDSNAELRRELRSEYEVVRVDVGRFDRHMDLAARYGAELKANGIPYLTVLAADGTVLANRETGSLEATVDGRPGHDPARVLAFLVEHQAPYPEARDLLDGALAQAAAAKKRVFLHFGAPWCGWCRKLEAWMAQPGTAGRLAAGFIDCKIDVDRTLGGKELLASMRGSDAGGIPWFAFLAADGSRLADSTGPGGNIGFPVEPQEVAHFRGMLRAAGTGLDDAALDALMASLAAPPAAAPGPVSGDH